MSKTKSKTAVKSTANTKASTKFEAEVNKSSHVVKEKAKAVQSDVIIWRTEDYGVFKLNEFNRDPSHYKKIKEAIKKNDQAKYMPILVDKNMNIVDGQNRYLACKELKKPIYFIVSKEIHINDAPDINSAAKNWSMTDYVRHYAKRGREPYIKMLDLAAKYGQRISVIAQFGKLKEGSRSHSENVRAGIFEFKSGVDVEAFFKHMSIFQQYYYYAKKERFIRAAVKLYSHKEYNPAVMEKKLRLASAIVHEQPRTDLMLEELVKLYNYHSRQPIALKK
ncbi:MAG: ParB N-terminal domain-containing protein [Nanoarchaeota archaeon]